MRRSQGMIARLSDDELMQLLGDMWLAWRFDDDDGSRFEVAWDDVWTELARRGLTFEWGPWWQSKT